MLFVKVYYKYVSTGQILGENNYINLRLENNPVSQICEKLDPAFIALLRTAVKMGIKNVPQMGRIQDSFIIEIARKPKWMSRS